MARARDEAKQSFAVLCCAVPWCGVELSQWIPCAHIMFTAKIIDDGAILSFSITKPKFVIRQENRHLLSIQFFLLCCDCAQCSVFSSFLASYRCAHGPRASLLLYAVKYIDSFSLFYILMLLLLHGVRYCHLPYCCVLLLQFCVVDCSARFFRVADEQRTRVGSFLE